MIAPAACALASVLSSSRSNTSSGIAPTSTALSLPSRGKLSNLKETSHFKDIAAYNCVKLKICFHLVIQTKQSVTVLLSSKQDSRTCECSWFGVSALKYHVICCPESVLDISRNVLIKKRHTLMSIYLKSMTSLAAFALIAAVLWDSNFVKLSIAPLSSADWVSIVIQ